MPTHSRRMPILRAFVSVREYRAVQLVAGSTTISHCCWVLCLKMYVGEEIHPERVSDLHPGEGWSTVVTVSPRATRWMLFGHRVLGAPAGMCTREGCTQTPLKFLDAFGTTSNLTVPAGMRTVLVMGSSSLCSGQPGPFLGTWSRIL